MADMDPQQLLDEHTRLLVKTLRRQLKISNPYLSFNHSPEIQGNGIFKEAIKVFLNIYLPKCDVGAKHVICKWLKLDESNLPKPSEAMEKMHHEHILGELAERGMIDLVIPKFTLITEETVPQPMPYGEKLPSFTVQGNKHQIYLITGPPISNPVLYLSFKLVLLKGYFLHHVDFTSSSEGDCSFGSNCRLCPGTIANYSNSNARSFRFLLYNARGAADLETIYEVDQYSIVNEIDFAIVTETRLRGPQSKSVCDLMNFNRSISMDAIGFSSGAWLMWNSNAVEFDLLRKTETHLSATIRILNQEAALQTPIDI